MSGLEGVLIGLMVLEMLFLLALLTLAVLPALARVVKEHPNPHEEAEQAVASRD
jgi:hypothetical protein